MCEIPILMSMVFTRGQIRNRKFATMIVITLITVFRHTIIVYKAN